MPLRLMAVVARRGGLDDDDVLDFEGEKKPAMRDKVLERLRPEDWDRDLCSLLEEGGMRALSAVFPAGCLLRCCSFVFPGVAGDPPCVFSWLPYAIPLSPSSKSSSSSSSS
jgi:hypothetical protein